MSIPEIIATISAMCTVMRTGEDIYEKYFHKKLSEVTQHDINLLSSTYNNEELAAISERLNNCRELFILEGGGESRARCLCSVLNNVRAGNGGNIPNIDDWLEVDKLLDCRNH